MYEPGKRAIAVLGEILASDKTEVNTAGETKELNGDDRLALFYALGLLRRVCGVFPQKPNSQAEPRGQSRGVEEQGRAVVER